MHYLKLIFCLLLCGLPLWAEADSQALPILHHEFNITPDFAKGELHVSDRVVLPEAAQAAHVFSFMLNPALELSVEGKVQKPDKQDKSAALYQLPLAEGQKEITLEYRGKLVSTPDCAWLTQACVRLDEKGLYLDGNSLWYPQAMADSLYTFNMNITLPDDWVSLSQGEQTMQGWRETLPQQDIYLLAGNFQVYKEAGQPTAVMVYLQDADPELAKRYLQASEQYLDEYSRLLGDYPYAKFAVAESFWETGWGMPSFTLLGSKVLRLPFILNTSLPHEILHNWWGNGVYVDAREGNWSEGLTAYLADYRLKAQSGEGSGFRRDTLQNYAVYVDGEADIPPADFRGRHDESSQAVGYGKVLMVFHMLESRMGREAFLAALKTFYQDYRFQTAGFNDLLNVMQAHAPKGKEVKNFALTWLHAKGAPHLRILSHALKPATHGKYRLELELSQRDADSGQVFPLDIPLVVQLEGKLIPDWSKVLHMDAARQSFTLMLPTRPVSLAVDPDFDVFRLPDPAEMPASLASLFGKNEKTLVLTRKTDEAMQLAWEAAAHQWMQGDKNIHLQYDDEPLPKNGTIVLLGSDTTALQDLLEQAHAPFGLTDTAYTLNQSNYTCSLHALALALRAGEQTVILLDAPNPSGLERMLEKLPHYGKYSYVLFDSTTGENVAKGQWELSSSPLKLDFTVDAKVSKR